MRIFHQGTALIVMGLTLVLASGCQSNIPESAALSQAQEKQVTDGAYTQTNDQHGQNTTIYQNHFFKVAIPDNWQVISTDGPDVPAFVTAVSKDHQALVTIRVSRSDLDVNGLCQLAAKGFVANGADIVQGPEVQYGTCVIKSDEVNRPTTLWLRAYEDHSVYAINFTGPMEKVNEILGRLEGNEKMMQLLISPL